MGATDHWVLLYNQDAGILFSHTADPITPAHVDAMVDQVAGAGVDVLLINPNMRRTNYPSQVWQRWWDGFEAWARENPPSEAPAVLKRRHWHHPRHPLRHHMIRQMKRLHEQGCDYLARALRRCRQHGMAAGVSIRMNDQHDRHFPDSHHWSSWHRRQPELRMRRPPSYGVAPLDYRHQAVRDHMFALIEEIVTGYPLDVLELDFLRHPHTFSPRNAADQAPIMTRFLGRVSRLCGSHGVRLLPRVPITPAAALELGLDLAAWARRQLVQGITVSPVMCTEWQAPVPAFRQLLGDGPALYVGTDKTADQKAGFPMRRIHSDPQLLRGFAASYVPWAGSCDGLYFFNFFGPRAAVREPHEPAWSTLAQLKRDDELAGQSKVYLTTAGDRGHGARSDGPLQVPVRLHDGFGRAFYLCLMPEPLSAQLEMTLWVVHDGEPAGAALWLRVNETPVGPAQRCQPYRQAGYRDAAAREASAAVYTLPRGVLQPGKNCFVLSHQGPEPLTIYGLEVHVSAAGGTA